MKAADLIFIALFLAGVVTLLRVGWLLFDIQPAPALALLKKLLVGAGVYMSVVGVSVVSPRRTVEPGARQCFDDWCIAVLGYRRPAHSGPADLQVDFRLSSRARRVSQRENNLVAYLVDGQEHRYDPILDSPWSQPFNVLLGPGESTVVRRSFLVPGGAGELSAVVAHEGGFPIGWFIIGYDTWFRKPPLVRLAKL